MKNLEQTLAEWRASTPKHVSAASIKLSDNFQPRVTNVVPFRSRSRLDAESENHVQRFRARLQSAEAPDLDPVLVAEIDGYLWLVDGHHRLKAYRGVGRRSIPACVRQMDQAEAVILSKLVNCDGAKLPMHADQLRDAAWQYLAVVTERGTRPLPPGNSTRSIATRFAGVSHTTIAAMLRRLPSIKVKDYQAAALDPATRWPRWTHCKSTGVWKDFTALVPLAERQQRSAKKIVAALWRMRDRAEISVFVAAMRMAATQAAADRIDGLPEALSAIADADNFDDDDAL